MPRTEPATPGRGPGPHPERDIERVFREEYGRAVAVLVRIFGDIDVAEEAVQEAFTTALERWPAAGAPPSPAGWIITTARNRAIDRLRRESAREDRHAQAVGAQPPGHLEAVEVGQHHVEDHEVRTIRLDLGESGASGIGGRYLEALVAQRRRDEVGDVRLVVDNEDAAGSSAHFTIMLLRAEKIL